MYNVLFFDYCKIKWKRLIRTIWVVFIIFTEFIAIDNGDDELLLIFPILFSIPFFLFSYVLKPFIVKMD